MTILTWMIQLILTPLMAPLCVGVINQVKARLQNRQGASIIQPYKDLWKLFHKDEIISRDASWIFRFTPLLIFAITIGLGASIPLFSSFLYNDLTGDMLVIVYALAMSTFFLALAGMDTGSAFGGFGASREMTISALAEGGLIFSLLTVALINNTTNLFWISSSTLFLQSHHLLPLSLAFGGFFIVLLAETGRFPFDNSATHLELTMIHEAMILEYSGKKLALMEWSAANKLFILSALGVNLFFPLGLAQQANWGMIGIGLVFLVIKILIFCLVIAVIESSMAKYRFFRLPDLLMISFIFNAVAISLVH